MNVVKATGPMCPHCKACNSRVRESRQYKGMYWRVRCCKQCGKQFTTYELHAEIIKSTIRLLKLIRERVPMAKKYQLAIREVFKQYIERIK